MVTNIDDLRKEYDILEQSKTMYQDTLEEMHLKNSNAIAIASIESEINKITTQQAAILNGINALNNGDNEKYAQEASIIYQTEGENTDKMKEFLDALVDKANKEAVTQPIPVRKRKNKKTYIPDNATPIKTNSFLVNFPEEYGIKPYMISSYYKCYTDGGNNAVAVTIREFEGGETILPVKIEAMKDEVFSLRIDTLDGFKNVYYTTVYENCRLNYKNIVYPYNSYEKSEIKSYKLSFIYDKVQFIINNETANKKNG